MLTLPGLGGGLPFLMPDRVERFYRAKLRRVAGSRLRSSAILAAYAEWAKDGVAADLSFKLLRDCMEAIGHGRRKSNGISYLDVAFAEDVPGLGDTLDDVTHNGQAMIAASAANGVLVAKVDALLSAALDLRTALVAAEEARSPHEAARRVLGLFGR